MIFQFGRMLRIQREYRDISEQDAAQFLQISVSQLRAIEGGSLPPPGRLVESYAELVRIPPKELVLLYLHGYATSFIQSTELPYRVKLHLDDLSEARA